jgi:hypothetical protein
MIYSDFINKTSRYLKSVRNIKNYVSFDIIFPSTWSITKKYPESIEVLQTDGSEGNVVTSFICENKKELLDLVETTIDQVVKTNIEREEKERLFKSKVQELKNIFESQKLENLKGLKFDLEEELSNLIENEQKEVTVGNRK